MEIEVKLRLPDASSHGRLKSLLSPHHIRTHHQHNLFFDGAGKELSSRRAVLRLRFTENYTRCNITLKANSVLINGISRVEEDEEELQSPASVALAKDCIAEAGKLGSLVEDSSVLRRCKEEFGVAEFVGLGEFRNVRDVYEWKGLKLEVDETSYDFGCCYEIECESEEPDRVKGLLEELLKENEINYKYSEKSKFAIFRSGKLP